MTGDERVDASVLIATRDRAASLARTLESLVAQQCSGLVWELLVVDNGPRQILQAPQP